MIFLLMNKDEVMGQLNISYDYINLVSATSKFQKFIGLLDNVSSWLESRFKEADRLNILKAIKISGMYNREMFLAATHGISLIDTFWVKWIGERITWGEINPYKNKLSNTVSLLALCSIYDGGELKSPSPDYNIAGSIDKCWKREAGYTYLYKTDGEKYSGVTGNRPYCEYYAQQVADAICSNKSNYTQYRLIMQRLSGGGSKAYAKCRNFTNEKMGLIAIGHTKYSKVELGQFANTLSKRHKDRLREMLLLDSIICNFDRHMGNYGILFDTDTLEIVGLAPIYDNDLSLGVFQSIQDRTLEEAYKEFIGKNYPKTNLGTFREQAQAVITPELYEKLKKMYPFKFKRLPKEIDLPDDRVEFMEYIVNRQLEQIITDTIRRINRGAVNK